MNELAIELNEVLESCVVGKVLSNYGKRMYFPKGIVAQSAAAREKATNFNATVGQAFTAGEPLFLDDINKCFNCDELAPKDIFTYAPGAGLPQLRALWKEDMMEKNPLLKGQSISTPVVTAGLTHAISLLLRMFLDSDDQLLLPHLFWDNYDLIVKENVGASFRTFPLYDETGLKFNLEGFEKAIEESKSEKVVTLLNFPNNPTGYTPTKDEMKEISEILIRQAEKGKKLVVISDDAYFGLFYDKDTANQSLFAYLANAHENILAIKGDAATKEAMVWGFRLGFITYGSKNLTKEQSNALETKIKGSIRCSVSNCSKPAQSSMIKALSNKENYNKGKQLVNEEMEKRFHIISNFLKTKSEVDYLKPLAFNSGYFLSFNCKGDPDELREYLLNNYGVGVINIMGMVLRVAYCSVDSEKLEGLFELIYKAAEELWS